MEGKLPCPACRLWWCLSLTLNVIERTGCRERSSPPQVQGSKCSREANVPGKSGRKPPTLSLHGGNQEGMGAGTRSLTRRSAQHFSRDQPVPEGEASRLPSLQEKQHKDSSGSNSEHGPWCQGLGSSPSSATRSAMCPLLPAPQPHHL